MRTRNFRELRERITADPQGAVQLEQAIRRAEAEGEAFRRTLAQLRRARAMTQTQLANALEVSQAQISRVEHQTDLYLSTLQSYLAAMGGRLELVAVFGDQRIPLLLEDLAGQPDADGEGMVSDSGEVPCGDAMPMVEEAAGVCSRIETPG